MSFSREIQILLLTCAIICAAVISCKPVDTQTTRKKLQSGDSAEQVKLGENTLSKKQITAAANATLRRHGYNHRKLRVFYDEGNVQWMGITRNNLALADSLKSRLEGRDYQFLLYTKKQPWLGWVLWVIIDRNTAEELLFIVQS